MLQWMETQAHKRQLLSTFPRHASSGMNARRTALERQPRREDSQCRTCKAEEETESQLSLSSSYATETAFLLLPAKDVAMCAKSLCKAEFAFLH